MAVKEYIFENNDGILDEAIKELILTSSLRSPFTVKIVSLISFKLSRIFFDGTPQMCAVLDGLGRPQGMVMEAMDCGWDKIVYRPNDFPITWTQRLSVLHSVAEGIHSLLPLFFLVYFHWIFLPF